MATPKPWTIQWHIAADGTVIQQRSRGAAEHEQLFQEFATTRTPTIEEIDAMVDRLQRSSEAGERRSKIFLYLFYVACAGFVLGIVLPWFGIEIGLLAVGSFAFILLASLSTGFMIRMSIGRYQRAFREAGFESSNGVTLAAREARVKIADPGTVSGREFAAVRA